MFLLEKKFDIDYNPKLLVLLARPWKYLKTLAQFSFNFTSPLAMDEYFPDLLWSSSQKQIAIIPAQTIENCRTLNLLAIAPLSPV